MWRAEEKKKKKVETNEIIHEMRNKRNKTKRQQGDNASNKYFSRARPQKKKIKCVQDGNDKNRL